MHFHREKIEDFLRFLIFDFWMKFGMWTTIGRKTTLNEFEIATAIFSLTSTPQATAQVTGDSGVRGSHSRGGGGPHHYQQNFMIFSLWREPPLLSWK